MAKAVIAVVAALALGGTGLAVQQGLFSGEQAAVAPAGSLAWSSGRRLRRRRKRG